MIHKYLLPIVDHIHPTLRRPLAMTQVMLDRLNSGTCDDMESTGDGSGIARIGKRTIEWDAQGFYGCPLRWGDEEEAIGWVADWTENN